jgi:hypothetical protein
MTRNPSAAFCRHRNLLAPPHYLKAGLLVVFDGVRGSGKTAQLSRLRCSQRSAGLYANEPLFMELPRDLDDAEGVAQRATAVAARAAGRPVFAEGWHPDDGVPDVTLLSLASFTDPTLNRAAPADLPENVVVTEPGFESLVTLQLFTVLGRRGLMAGCPCGLRG